MSPFGRTLVHDAASVALTATARTSRKLWKPSKATIGFLFSHAYQRPYLESLLDVADHIDGARCLRIDGTSPGQSLRVPIWSKIRRYDYVIHSHPFQTGAFYDKDIRHVWVSHGIDNGMSDGLGTFSTGPGRMLTARRQRIYSHLMVGFEWGKELAEDEVPEYRGRVFVIGDKRRERIRQLEDSRPRVRQDLGIGPHEKCVVIVTTHSGRCLIANHSEDLMTLLEVPTPGIRYRIIIHPFATQKYPDLSRRLTLFCEAQGLHAEIADQTRIEELLVAADLMISDHGSLSLYYALLGRPLAYVPLDEGLRPGWPLRTTAESSYRIQNLQEAAELVRALADDRLPCSLKTSDLRRLDRFGTSYRHDAQKAIESLVHDLGIER